MVLASGERNRRKGWGQAVLDAWFVDFGSISSVMNHRKAFGRGLFSGGDSHTSGAAQCIKLGQSDGPSLRLAELSAKPFPLNGVWPDGEQFQFQGRDGEGVWCFPNAVCKVSSKVRGEFRDSGRSSDLSRRPVNREKMVFSVRAFVVRSAP